MATLTPEQIFDVIAPDYANDPDKAVYLQIAEMRVSDCAYGDNRPLAVALRAAHDITLAKSAEFSGSGGSGPVTSKKEGQLAISYGESDSSSNGGDLSMTKYGKQLLGLSNEHIAAVGVTGGADNGCCR